MNIYIHLEQKCKFHRMLSFLEVAKCCSLRLEIRGHAVAPGSDVEHDQAGDHENYPSGHEKRIDD